MMYDGVYSMYNQYLLTMMLMPNELKTRPEKVGS